MITRILLILLCLGILSMVNGCYVETSPYGYDAPRPSVSVYPRPYVYVPPVYVPPVYVPPHRYAFP